MASLNLCQFIGNIGRIETRYLTNGDAVTNFSIAVNDAWKDKDGNKQEKCEWVNVVAYKKLAEIMSQFCEKGMQIYVSGKLQTRKWQNKEGVDVYTTEIIADRMQMLGGKRDDGEERPQQKQDSGENWFEDFDGDVPF